MKRIISLLFFFVSCSVYAQKIPDFGFDKVNITEADKVIKAEIIPVSSEPVIKPDRYYFWYSASMIHSTQGGYSGQLLNGLYTEFYLNKNMKEQGNFKKGLKTGIWKSWKEDGSLMKTTSWKNGLLLPDSAVSVWYKLNPFRKKTKPTNVSPQLKPS